MGAATELVGKIIDGTDLLMLSHQQQPERRSPQQKQRRRMRTSSKAVPEEAVVGPPGLVAAVKISHGTSSNFLRLNQRVNQLLALLLKTRIWEHKSHSAVDISKETSGR